MTHRARANKKPEKWILKSDILGNALDDYDKKIGIKELNQ